MNANALAPRDPEHFDLDVLMIEDSMPDAELAIWRLTQGGFRCRYRVVTRGRALASVILISVATAACNFLTTEDDPRHPPDVFDKVRAIDLLPRFPKPTGTTSTGPTDGAVMYSGTATSTTDAGVSNATTYHYGVWVQRDGDRMDAVATTPASIQVY